MGYDKELAIARLLTKQAGARILELYRQGYSQAKKDDDSPVTQADLEGDRIISEGLREAFPDDALLTEESEDDQSRLSSRRVWIVDPLDGTKEFIKQTGEFTVNVALVEDGSPVVGVVLVPARNTMYWAVSGAGAFKDGERIGVSEESDTAAMTVTVSRSHCTEDEEAFIQAAGFANRVPSGSSVKGCRVAQGTADVYARFGPVHEWDVCAMQLVIEEAGGQMTMLDGSVRVYNQADTLIRGFLASNGKAHEHLLSLCPR